MLLVSYCCVLKETIYKIALTMQLPNWRIGLKQINVQNLTICVISNKIRYYNENVQNVQIDNNLT